MQEYFVKHYFTDNANHESNRKSVRIVFHWKNILQGIGQTMGTGKSLQIFANFESRAALSVVHSFKLTCVKANFTKATKTAAEGFYKVFFNVSKIYFFI